MPAKNNRQADGFDRQAILDFVRSRRYRPMTTHELAARFSVGREALRAFGETLHDLQLEGAIVELKERRWADPARAGISVGHLHASPQGYGFVIPVAGGEDIYVAARDMGGAMHNDLVAVERHERRRGGRRSGAPPPGPSGRIVRVLSRANEQVIGVFNHGRKWSRVVPDDPRLGVEVQVPPGREGGARPGEKVLVCITKWPQPGVPGSGPEGHVVRVLGKEGDPGVDVLSVIIEFNLPTEFSSAALSQAAALPPEPSNDDRQGRLDLRRLTTIAIDPEDARDRDDALSFRMDKRAGRRIVHVHIADVSHYVPPDSPMDRDAFERGCSVYLVSDFIPMLPRDLTQKVLSFAEGKERLAKTVTLEFDNDAELVASSISRSVVKASVVTSYGAVQELLSATDREDDAAWAAVAAKWPENAAQAVIGLDKLARQLRAKRHRLGSVDLDVPEYNVRVAEDGRVTAVSQIERDRSHALVEEFMLCANCVVADYLKAHRLPGLWRIHEPPDEEDVEAFSEFIKNVLGREVNPLDRSQLQDLLADVRGTNLAEAVNMELLRCMKRAMYAPAPRPHFALHFDNYCHFTSPIRRYPDLVVHQVLDQHFTGRMKGVRAHERWRERLPEAARASSAAELRADRAEREIVKIKLLRFLQERGGPQGEVFDAVITGVQQYGVFAQIQRFSVEGLVKVGTIGDDHYRYDEGRRALVGRRTRRTLRLGQSIKVLIESIDIQRRQMNLLIAD
jgi:ribonuclease R